MTKPNIVIIKTDQQRADTIAYMGNEHMITPALDDLCGESISFTNAFCCGATCVASRAAFFTGRYAHNTGVYEFNKWTHLRTWLHNFKENGYHLSAIGKVHHIPMSDNMAYDERISAENFPTFENWDDYSNYLKQAGQDDYCKLLTKDRKWLEKCCSAAFPLEEKYFVDNWIGSQACQWIHQRKSDAPFLLNIGFVGPHDPFAPPKRFIDMYEQREVPEPIDYELGYENKPPQYKRFMEQCINPVRFEQAPGYGVFQVRIDDKSSEQLKNMRRHYYARITAIDEQVGKIMAELKKKNILDNTIVIFTSDHGENLGDHRMMYKWLMTEQATKVPLMIRLPSAKRAGTKDHKLFSHIDIGPTLLRYAGFEIPAYLDGSDNYERIENADLSKAPQQIYCQDNYLTLIRTQTDKMVYYAGRHYGEYYDLSEDPKETNNLYQDTNAKVRINELKLKLLDFFATSRYLGSSLDVDLGPCPARYWPEYHKQDPYILSGQPRPERLRI